MLDYRLSKQELAELRAAHRRAANVREAYRINAVILLGKGRTAADVADALLIDQETVRTYFKRYKKGGVEELLRMNYVGSEALLDAVQLAELDAHLQSSKAVAEHLENSRSASCFCRLNHQTSILIERFWKFFKRQILYNRYYEAFIDYKNACKRFFRELDSYVSQLRSLLTENFEIIGD